MKAYTRKIDITGDNDYDDVIYCKELPPQLPELPYYRAFAETYSLKWEWTFTKPMPGISRSELEELKFFRKCPRSKLEEKLKKNGYTEKFARELIRDIGGYKPASWPGTWEYDGEGGVITYDFSLIERHLTSFKITALPRD